MQSKSAVKSQKIFDTFVQNVDSFRSLLPTVEDEVTKQNILRSMILFSCSGIDAIVKQLIKETLEGVIERDEGAQDQLRVYTERKIKNKSEIDYSLLAELFTARSPRKYLIRLMEEELSFDSLQSADQLYKVAARFNIPTSELIEDKDKSTLTKAFSTRNIIVHQMDVDLKKENIEIIKHEIAEVEGYYETMKRVAQRFIDAVNIKLQNEKTKAYRFAIDDGEGNITLFVS